MMNLDLQEAKKLYISGNVELSITKLKEILKKEPNNFDILSFLGAIYAQLGKYLVAKSLLEKAIGIKKDDYDCNINLIYVLTQLKDYDSVILLSNRMVEQHPDDYWANLNYATSLLNQKNITLGIEYLKKCIVIDANNFSAWFNLGHAHQELNQLEDAIKYFDAALAKNSSLINIYIQKFDCHLKLQQYEKILDVYKKNNTTLLNNFQIEIQVGLSFANINIHNDALTHFENADRLLPNNYYAKFNLALSNYKLGRLTTALSLYEDCLNLNKSCKESLVNKVILLNQLRRYEESILFAEKILTLDPGNYEISINIGKALLSVGRYEDSLKYTEKVLADIPTNELALFNKATVLQAQKKYEEAIKIYSSLIATNKEYHDAENNLAITYLLSSKFELGWKFYDARWRKKNPNSKYLATKLPEFNIECRMKKTFIWREQGLGDEILFSSMYANIKQICDEFTIQVDLRLLSVFKRSYPEFNFVSDEKQISEDKYYQQLPSGSLGKYLRKNIKDFENQKNNLLCADRKLVELFRKKINPYGNKICGITWKSKNSEFGAAKSFNLLDLAPILKIPNYTFINLQYGDVSEEILEFINKNNVNLINLKEVDHFNDIESHLALIDLCDLLVLSSNSTAHLSGALGKKTYVIAPAGHQLHWYWNNNTEDGTNMWYPSLKVYQQKEPNEWSYPIENVKKEMLI